MGRVCFNNGRNLSTCHPHLKRASNNALAHFTSKILITLDSGYPRLDFTPEVTREQLGLLVNQSLKGLVLAVSDPLDLDPALEELVQVSKDLACLLLVEDLPLPGAPAVHDLNLDREILLVDPLTVAYQEVVYQIARAMRCLIGPLSQGRR